MSKLDLKDVTFMIPVRYESQDRRNNVRTVVKYMLHHLDTNIMILEDDKVSHTKDVLGPLYSQVTHIFNHNKEYLFHRTRFLNEMAMTAKTPYIVNYDSDLIIPKSAYEAAAYLLRANEADYVISYSGAINKVIQKNHSQLLVNMNPHEVQVPTQKMAATNGSPCWFKKDMYIKGGMENEHFLSWGYEDNERYARFVKLGLRLQRTKNQMWHLEHARVANNFNSNPHLGKNRQLHESTARQTPEEVAKRVLTFPWLDKYEVRSDTESYLKDKGFV
jgi:hypothetical protein